jgi:integrase
MEPESTSAVAPGSYTFEITYPSTSRSEEPLPDGLRWWTTEGELWVERQQKRGKYQGRNGSEANRFFRKCGERLQEAGVLVPPTQVTEEHLQALLPITGKAPASRRFYYTLLGGFLILKGNPIIRQSEWLQRFPKTDGEQRRLTVIERNAMFDKSVGLERVALAFFNSTAIRRIELLRMRVDDLDLVKNFVWVRGKGYASERSRKESLNGTLRRELERFLPLRASWAVRASKDDGKLLAWLDGSRLRGYSYASVDRLVITAGQRIGKRVTCHDLRRTAADVARAGGADIWKIQTLLGHKSIDTTRRYLKRLDATKEVEEVAAMLEVPVS